MDTLNILLVVAAAFVGAIITFYILKVKQLGMSRPLKNESIQAEKDPVQKSEMTGRSIEVDELKKTIKNLKNELESAEDDLVDTEKKLRNRDAQYNELKEKNDKLETNHKKSMKEITEIRFELEQKEKELGLKMESLEFVKSILSATEVKNSATNELYRKINEVSRFLEEEILGAITSIYGNDAKNFKNDIKDHLKKWEATQKKNWIAGKTAIAFVGEFSAGKTSIVNRILSQDDPNVHRLPVSTKPTTAIPTYISGGVKTDYLFFTQDNRLKSIKESDFIRVTKEVLDQVNGVSNLIQYFVISYKNENLNDLSILDTPGFNSKDKEDAERTLEVINECDALFWVFDVNAGTVNKTSIDLIKDNLKKPLYVIINKVDTKSKSEVDKVEKLIKDTFAHENLRVNGYIRFSSVEPLENIVAPIKQILRNDENSIFIETTKDKLNEKLKELKNSTKAKKKEYDKWRRIVSSNINKYNEAMAELRESCETAYSMPHYNSRFFSSDDYRMSQYEYKQLCELLETIQDSRAQKLIELYDEQQDNQQKLQQAYEEWQKSQYQAKQVQELLSRWDKYIKDLYKFYNK